MWIFSQHGFVSIVAHYDQPDTFMARARERADLENIQTIAGLTQDIVETPRADYLFRLIVNHKQIQTIMTRLGETVDYPNFKTRVGETPGQKHKLDAYHKIWAVMKNLPKEKDAL